MCSHDSQLVLSFLTAGGVIHPSPKFAEQDIKVGITALLITVEMALFSLLHLFAFSARPYHLKKVGSRANKYSGGFLGIFAWIDAFNPWDFIKAIARGARWLVVGIRRREQDPSYRRQHAPLRPDSAFSARDGLVPGEADDPVVPLAVSGSPPAGALGTPHGDLGPYGLDHWESGAEAHQMTETGRPSGYEYSGHAVQSYNQHYGAP